MNVAMKAADPAQAKWTVLLYSAADNNLTPYMVDDIKECESVGSDSFTKVACQVDQGASIGAARYLLEKATNPNPSGISSPKLADMGQIDMANPDTLADFITWGMKQYPAEHTMVIISDHGGGWPGAVQDESAGTWMSSPMIRQAFEKAEAATGKKVDVLGMDACLMASSEFMNEMKGCADFIVASEKTEGGDGWAYSKILNAQLLEKMQEASRKKIDMAPRDLARLGVSSAATRPDVLATMSAMDTSKVGAVQTAFDHLGSAILDTKTSMKTIATIFNGAQNFDGFSDAVDLANGLIDSKKVKDANLKAAAKEVVDAVNGAVIAEEHADGYPGAHGLTIDASTYGVQSGYNDLVFAQGNHWPAALDKIAKANQ